MVSKALINYIVSRVLAYVATMFTAFSITFLLLKAIPTSIVELIIEGMRATGAVYDPQALIALREALYDIFGLRGSLLDQYITFMKRFLTMDFGPSMISFPTPAKELVFSYLPWTLGLLLFTTLVSWVIGNILGSLSVIYRGRGSKILQSIALTLYPIPYYILALVLIFLFAYAIPIFPIGGGGGMIVYYHFLSLEFWREVIYRSTLPSLSMLIPGIFGWWFLSSRVLSINVVSEDFYVYGEIRGLPQRYLYRKYVLRNILLPQTTALSLALGGIFGGALLTEAVFAYPGLGLLLYRAVGSGDYGVALSILSLSIIGIATATLIIDLVYPLLDPRVRYR